MIKHNEGFTLIELMIVVVIIGILAAIAIPNFVLMKDRAKEASVKSNCHTVQLAAEDFAMRNGGVYSDGNSVLPSGDTLVDLLPGGHLLTNPFTKAASEPQFGVAAATAGQIGYQGIVQNGTTAGYLIGGMGRDPASGLVILLSSGQ